MCCWKCRNYIVEYDEVDLRMVNCVFDGQFPLYLNVQVLGELKNFQVFLQNQALLPKNNFFYDYKNFYRSLSLKLLKKNSKSFLQPYDKTKIHTCKAWFTWFPWLAWLVCITLLDAVLITSGGGGDVNPKLCFRGGGSGGFFVHGGVTVAHFLCFFSSIYQKRK